MIYLVTLQQELFGREEYKIISVKESLAMMKNWKIVQYDSETLGRDPIIGKLLMMQFGSIDKKTQIVVDAATVNPLEYKEVLETKFVITQNGKFDLQWLFNYGIVVKKLYDTMIAEQLKYMGFPFFMIGANNKTIMEYSRYVGSYTDWKKLKPEEKKQLLYRDVPETAAFIYEHSGVSLKALCYRYCNYDMDKSVRGKIQYEGICPETVIYGAGDVVWLYDIMQKQLEWFKKLGEIEAIKVECDFVICCAYYEWCGVELDVPLWHKKFTNDYKKLNDALDALNKFVVDYGDKRFYTINRQLNLFEDVPIGPVCKINWQSTQQVIPFLTELGFNCKGIDKSTKEEKDTIEASVLKPQKGINDEFLKIYFEYTETYKLCTTYGLQYINAVNPKDGRIHTVFRQLSTDTGRLSCGSQEINTDLAKLKGLPQTKSSKKIKGIEALLHNKVCAYPQLQNLPNDPITRQCFKAHKGNKIVAIDYSSEESRLMASMAHDEAMIDEYINGDGDMHSLTAKMVFKDELKDVPIKDIKKFSKDNHTKGGINYRQEAKGYEFLFNYHGNADTIVRNYGLTKERAEEIEHNYMDGFKGLKKFQDSQCKFVCQHGYILISPVTGHKSWWWDYGYWKEVQASFTSDFWDEYRTYHKGTGDNIAQKIKKHFQAKTKYEKNACNSPLQGSGAIIFKIFNRRFFDWICNNGLFGKVKFCVPAHDEIVCECPEDMTNTIVKELKYFMSDSGKPFCTELDMPAEEEVADYWKH